MSNPAHQNANPGVSDHRTQTQSDATNPIVLSQPLGVFPFLAPPREPGELGRLGTYRILGVLGEGGMGIVFRAEDLVLQRSVALKVMQPNRADQEMAQARFLREARSAAAIMHENVIPILHVGEDFGTPYLVMPLLQGRTLADHLAAEPCPGIQDAFWIGRAVSEGLAAAHALGLVHRDIKPANIWIEDRGTEAKTTQRIKILDFGLARLADSVSPHDGQPGGNDGLTAAGIAMGTPHYMSPEQTRAAPLDHRTDLFSLGTVLYEMCAGRMPFDGTDPIAVLTAVASHSPPTPRTINPKVPQELDRLIMRLLAKNADDRPASAQEVSAELKRIWRAVTRPTADPMPKPVEPTVLPALEPLTTQIVPSAPPILIPRVSPAPVVVTAQQGPNLTTLRTHKYKRARPVPQSGSARSMIVGMGLLLGLTTLVWGVMFLSVGQEKPPIHHLTTTETPQTDVGSTSPRSGIANRAADTETIPTKPATSSFPPGYPPPRGFPPPPGYPPPRGFPPPPPPPGLPPPPR